MLYKELGNYNKANNYKLILHIVLYLYFFKFSLSNISPWTIIISKVMSVLSAFLSSSRALLAVALSRAYGGVHIDSTELNWRRTQIHISTYVPWNSSQKLQLININSIWYKLLIGTIEMYNVNL